MFNLASFDIIFEGKNAVLNSTFNKAKKKCSFMDNAGTCVEGNIGLLSRLWGLGLACMAFGPECAGAIGITCAVKAAIATDQGKCISSF